MAGRGGPNDNRGGEVVTDDTEFMRHPGKACRGVDTNIFFPSRYDDNGQAAKAICARCPVIDECLAYALSLPFEPLDGIWGGLSKNERRQLKRRRRSVLAS